MGKPRQREALELARLCTSSRVLCTWALLLPYMPAIFGSKLSPKRLMCSEVGLQECEWVMLTGLKQP